MNSVGNVSMKGSLVVAGALLLAALAAAKNGGGASLKLLKQFSYERSISVEARASTIAFDRGHIYLSSPDGEVLETESLDPSSGLRTIFQPPTVFVNGLYVFEDVLYVTVRPRPGYLDHTLFRSKDQGQTFQPIDHGLAYCVCGMCGYLQTTEVYARNNLVYVNAGGGENLLVTADEGETYRRLSGQSTPSACSGTPFDISGTTVSLGGKCGVGNAFLSRGVLSPDGQSLAEQFEAVNAPAFEDRKVNAVRIDRRTSLVYAALEGQLLRSSDGGKSFGAVYDYPTGGDPYPYVGAILFASGSDLTVIGGWNKNESGIEKPFLGYLRNNGTQWADISDLLADTPRGIVTDLEEDEDGRLIAVVVDVVNKNVLIHQVRVPQRDEED